MAIERRHTKGVDVSYLLARVLKTSTIFFWIIEKPKYPWLRRIILRNPRLKNLKYILTLDKKKLTPKIMW